MNTVIPRVQPTRSTITVACFVGAVLGALADPLLNASTAFPLGERHLSDRDTPMAEVWGAAASHAPSDRR